MIWREWVPNLGLNGERAIKMTKSITHNGVSAELVIRNDGTCKSLIGDGVWLEERTWGDLASAEKHATEVIATGRNHRPEKESRIF